VSSVLKNIKRIRDRYYLHRYIYPFIKRNKDRQISFENNICLFSFPRSGSTWLSEILLTIPGSCLFDEPLLRNTIESPNVLPRLEIRKFKEIAENNFYFFQPIPADAKEPECKTIFEILLKGQALSIGLYNDYGLHVLSKSKIFVTKFNHANLLSCWLANQFDFASISLFRNPYSCIASIIRHPLSKKLTIPDIIRIPDFKHNEIYLQHQERYNKIRSVEEYYAFLWSLNFKEGFKKNKGLKIYYEDLLLNYDSTLKKIFNYLKIPVPVSSVEKRFNPSKSTINYAIENIKNQKQIDSWKQSLSQSQKMNIKSILNYFEIPEFYDSVD